MKCGFIVVLLLFATTTIQSQLWKDIMRDTKNDVKWKIRSKANQKIDDGLDSLLAAPNKQGEKKKNRNKKSNNNTNTNSNSNNGESEGMNFGEGFIRLSVSANEVFRGGTVIVTGNSVNYGNLKQVKMHTRGPGIDEEKTLSLYENGSFSTPWEADVAGEFTITVKSSDGKDQQSTKIKVYDIDVMDDLWVKENIELIHKTYDKLKQEAQRVEQLLSQRDKAELEQKLGTIKVKVDLVLNLFNNLDMAAGELGKEIKKPASLPSNLSGNLSQLNDKLQEQYASMKQVADAANHEPYDNSVCEYLVMLNEACAAFSTITNFWSKSLATLLKNTVMNSSSLKGQPGASSQSAKYFQAAQVDAEALTGKLGLSGFAGEMIQFASDVLMRRYCTVFKGQLNHDYKITYRNNAGVTWWSYSYETAAAVTFRYPKSNSSKGIKMKGNIEGNATKFAFYQDVEQMDEFRDQMKGRAKLTPIPLIKPVAVPFATSQKDEFGFGAVARGVGTPSYFNIPFDAEYDTEAETIKIFLNDALVDFTPLVKYTYGYVAIAAGIPLVTRVDYPINKAKLTLNAVVAQNNNLKISSNSNNLKGDGSRHIGSSSSPIEHEINYSLSAKKD